jgi:hypothetical protein
MNLNDTIELLQKLPPSTQIVSVEVVMGKDKFHHRYIDKGMEDKLENISSKPLVGRMQKILNIYRGKSGRYEDE